jgi:phage gp36-like protein
LAYAQIADLAKLGIQAAALSSLDNATKQAALDATAEQMDGYFRARFALPTNMPGWQSFTSWGVDVTRINVIMAVYDLMVVRGYNPAAAADEGLRLRYKDCLEWLRGVARQEIQPNVTPKQHESPGYDQPTIDSHAARGW